MSLMKFSFLVCLFSVVFISCSDDEPEVNCDNIDYPADFVDTEDAIAQAQVNHLLDSSNENCKILKDLIVEYIDMLEAIENCERTPFEDSDYDVTLTNLRSDLEGLSC